jgi:hypothetical protein
MRIRHLLPAAALALAATAARAQIAIDTARGLVGGHPRLAVHLPADPAGGTVTLAGTMKLSNPTVFFPERFIAPAGDTIVDTTLTALKDSIYTFSVTVARAASPRAGGDTLLYLEGEALAGSDSLCVITFPDASLGGSPATLPAGRVITKSIGPPLPYVRFAILEQNYPNPVPRGASTIWAYRIDRFSDVRFYFYNLLGQELEVIDLGEKEIGPHTFTYTPGITMPSGAYFVRLVTNTGSADKVMHIVH